MTKPLIGLSDLLAKAEAAKGPYPWGEPEVWTGDVGISDTLAEFIAAASPDVVKKLVEALNAASKWSMSPSTFLGRHGFKP